MRLKTEWEAREDAIRAIDRGGACEVLHEIAGALEHIRNVLDHRLVRVFLPTAAVYVANLQAAAREAHRVLRCGT